jgi:hypothetical protein
MHRSGTSAITRALNLLGFPLGSADDLHHGWDNPGGHWESSALIDCNDCILGAMGGSWEMPPRLRIGWENRPPATGLLEDMHRSFRVAYGEVGGAWVWKDPRTCLTFPLWRRVLPDPTVVIVLRDPHHVARSLKARESMRTAYGLALWRLYTASAALASAGLPTVVVRYGDVVRDPSRGLDGLAAGLEQLGIAVTGDVRAAAGSVSTKARSDNASPLDDATSEIWDALESLPSVSSSFTPPQSLESWHDRREWRMLPRVRVVAARPLRRGLLPKVLAVGTRAPQSGRRQ